jgi:hypothetical protein
MVVLVVHLVCVHGQISRSEGLGLVLAKIRRGGLTNNGDTGEDQSTHIRITMAIVWGGRLFLRLLSSVTLAETLPFVTPHAPNPVQSLSTKAYPET